MLAKNFVGSVWHMTPFKLGFKPPVLEKCRTSYSPQQLDQLTNHNSTPLFSFVVQNNPFTGSFVHSFKCWRQSRLESLARRHTRQQLAETKENLHGDTQAERKPDRIYQGRGRASELTGKVGYAKQHQEKKFQNKTGRAKPLKQNKEEVEKISTDRSRVSVSTFHVIYQNQHKPLWSTYPPIELIIQYKPWNV